MLKSEQQNWLKTLKGLDHPTPFVVTDTSILRHNVRQLQKDMPAVDVYYAIKSASQPEVINAIDGLVSGYDIASLGEFESLRALGIAPERMLYSNPVKVPAHIQKTFDAGLRHYAFDSLTEIQKLATYAPGSSVYLRLKVSDYGSKFPLSKKFGVDPLHAVVYMDTAREAGLRPCGLSFHVGSQSENPRTWETAFKLAGETIERLQAVGIEITLLDIGGGFPKTYTEKIPTLKQISKVINDSIKKYIPKGVRVVSEPGRFVSADASVVVTSVIGREHRGSDEWLFLDMGVFQGLMECLEMPNWKYPIFTNQGEKANLYARPFALTGPSCDAYDTIGFDYMLPPDLKVGDRLYIGVAGAYTSVYESKFNGFDPPKKYYI